MNKWFVVLMLATVALSGCTDDGADPDPVVDDFRDEFEEQGTDSADDASDEPAGNEADDAASEVVTLHPDLTASAMQVNQGTAFELTASVTANNQDGNPVQPVNLTWALFSQDESLGLEESGTELPATVEFTVDATGTHTFVLGVNADHANETFVELAVEILGATEQPEAEPERWNLYVPAPDGSCGDPFMSKGGGEDSGCRSLTHPIDIIFGPVTDASGPLPVVGDSWNTFPADAATTGHAAGAVVSGTYGWFTVGAGTGTFEWELLADGALVASDSETVDMGPGLGDTQYNFDGVLAADVDAGSMLTFRYSIRSLDYYEADGYDRYLTIEPA